MPRPSTWTPPPTLPSPPPATRTRCPTTARSTNCAPTSSNRASPCGNCGRRFFRCIARHSPSASVAGERFDIDPHEIDLITNANFVTLAVAWNTANPTTDLVLVPAFLQAGSITYESLLELLEIVWVRGGAAAVTLQGVNDNCDISVQTLAPAPIDAGVLDRMHRFLRLWRHGGWKMWELDLLLGAPLVGNNVLDENALVTLFTFRLLQDATGLAVDQQLAFFQDIDSDINGHCNPDGSRTTSLYGQIFLDPAVPVDADIAAIESGGAITAFRYRFFRKGGEKGAARPRDLLR